MLCFSTEFWKSFHLGLSRAVKLCRYRFIKFALKISGGLVAVLVVFPERAERENVRRNSREIDKLEIIYEKS